MLVNAWSGVVAANTLELTHTVYLGGLYMGSFNTEVEQDKNRYLIQTDAATNKSMSWMFSWIAKGASQGTFEELKFKPEMHTHYSKWRDKERGADLTYTNSGDVKVDLVGKPYSDMNKYTPVKSGSISGSMDPLTMVLAALNRFEKNGSCSGSYPVYDGRRRYDVLLRDAGVRSFKKSNYSVFRGEARGCAFEVVEKGGFRKEKSYELEDPSDLVVWVASPTNDTRPVPVRMQVKTQLGMLELHLDQYRMGDTRLASQNSK
ncbi:DUF3108 domain-containing protein [Sneathiella limimaris]|uniref:DUF3108 domain-containing protein n=1 Tax=Sneathiella limimaris TaxID=1964213 RepID=UPI00146DB755